MKELLIQRVTDKFECNSDLNTSWLKTIPYYLTNLSTAKQYQSHQKGQTLMMELKFLTYQKSKSIKWGYFPLI